MHQIFLLKAGNLRTARQYNQFSLAQSAQFAPVSDLGIVHSQEKDPTKSIYSPSDATLKYLRGNSTNMSFEPTSESTKTAPGRVYKNQAFTYLYAYSLGFFIVGYCYTAVCYHPDQINELLDSYNFP